MGKGVLVQKTLWGNLILGPTAADVADPATAARSAADISAWGGGGRAASLLGRSAPGHGQPSLAAVSAILSKCRELVPAFDAGAVIHSFSGARAKSSRGDWIIERCATAPDAVHAAGIDSPGLAGSPAIALEVVRLLGEAGLAPRLLPNPRFNPQRRAIVAPKVHSKVAPQTALLDASAAGAAAVRTAPLKVDSGDPSTNMICKCERVSEAEVVEALRRSLPAGSTQAIRKRTRAGMGHCQGGEEGRGGEGANASWRLGGTVPALPRVQSSARSACAPSLLGSSGCPSTSSPAAHGLRRASCRSAGCPRRRRTRSARCSWRRSSLMCSSCTDTVAIVGRSSIAQAAAR